MNRLVKSVFDRENSFAMLKYNAYHDKHLELVSSEPITKVVLHVSDYFVNIHVAVNKLVLCFSNNFDIISIELI